MKDAAKKAGIVVLAMFLSAGAFGFCGMEREYDSFLYYIAVYAMYGLIQRAQSIQGRKMTVYSLVFSVLLTVSFAVGHQVNLEARPYYPDLTLLDWAYLIPFAGLVFVCVLNLTDWLVGHVRELTRPKERINQSFWRTAFLVLVLFWMPYFLVFYPGNLALDGFEAVQQAMGVIPYASNHPVAFNAVLSVMIRFGMLFGDINFGIACFSLVQMLLLAGILSYILYWMKSKGVPDWIVLLSGGFYALNPIIPSYAVEIGKDTLFSGAFLLLMVYLYDAYESKGETISTARGLVVMSAISIFLSLWRNGIVAGVCVILAVLALCYRKYAKRLVPVYLAVLCLIFVIIGPVYNMADLPDSHAAESLGIPLQQIGYTLEQGGTVDSESAAFLDSLMPLSAWPEAYAPGGADGIKFHYLFDTEFLDNNTGTFLRMWAKVLPDNLKSYIKAWQMNTLGYYHIGTSEDAIWYGIIPAVGVEEMGIYRTDLIHHWFGTDLPARLIEAFFFFMYDLPVFNIIYSIAASVWLMLLNVMLFLVRRKKGKFGCLWLLMPLIALWCIILFTVPVSCEFRYMFALHLALPLLVLSLFYDMEGQTNE